MGLILDLAVVILAGLVIGSLALLAWTLAVSSVRSVRRGRVQVARARRSVADAEARLRSGAADVATAISTLAARAATAAQTSDSPGDRSDT